MIILGENDSVCLREYGDGERGPERMPLFDGRAGYQSPVFYRSVQSPEILDQGQSARARYVVRGSLSGNMKRVIDGDSDDVAWKDVRPSKREEIRGVIERLSKPSKIRSIFGSGLTEHAKKYGGPMDLADSVALDRQVDAEYEAREKAGRSKKSPGNRRA